MTTCCTPPATSTTTQQETPGVKPRYNVDGDANAWSIRVELPGVKKENVTIGLDGEVLTIQAKRTSSVPSEWRALHRELSEEDFLLRLKLNAPVDENKLSAKLEHGVLTVALPAKEAAKPRTIPVA